MSTKARTTLDAAKVKTIANRAAYAGLYAAGASMVLSIRSTMANKMASKPGDPPAVGFGTLWRGIAHTEPKNGSMFIHSGGTVYARTQQFGNPNHHASKKQYLAIPLGYAGKRLAAKTSVGGESSLRNAAVPLRVIRSRKGNLLLVPMTKGGSGKARFSAGAPLFVLKKSVKIPARPFLPAKASIFQPQLAKAMKDFTVAARRAVESGVRQAVSA